MGTHLECLVNRLFVSIMSRVLIVSVLSIVYLSPYCHGYSLGLYCQSFICLHGVMGTHWSLLSIVYLSPWCQDYKFRVYCQSSRCLHSVKFTHWQCLVNRLYTAMMSRLLIIRAPDKSVLKTISLFLIQKRLWVLKRRLCETVLLSTQITCLN